MDSGFFSQKEGYPCIVLDQFLWFLSIYFLSVFPNHADAKALGYWMFDDKDKLGKDSSGLDNHGEPKKAAAFDGKGTGRGCLEIGWNLMA